VVLAPVDPESTFIARIQAVNADGTYSLTSLPPGSYRIVAVPAGDARVDGGNVIGYEDAMEDIEIAAGDKIVKDLKRHTRDDQ